MGGKQQPADTERAKGTIQHTYPVRGFGFIRCTEGGAKEVGVDFFFHDSGLVKGLAMTDLLPGSLVAFDPTYPPRGPRAESIALAEEPVHAATERATRS